MKRSNLDGFIKESDLPASIVTCTSPVLKLTQEIKALLANKLEMIGYIHK